MTRTTLTGGSIEQLKALSDPTRWAVVALLAHGERCVCDLEASLEAAQSRLSYHLGVLRSAGLVNVRRDGRWVYYSLRPEGLTEIASELGDLSETWTTVGRHVPPRSCS